MPYCTRSGWTAAANGVHAIPGPIAELPDGTVIAAVDEAYTIVQGRSFRWSEQGYQVERQALDRYVNIAR
jgi:hypothetical protein